MIPNAGIDHPGPFDLIERDEVGDIISVNMIHPTFMAQVAVKYFEKRKGKSLIVNISTVMDQHKSPGFALYTSTKSYIRRFT